MQNAFGSIVTELMVGTGSTFSNLFEGGWCRKPVLFSFRVVDRLAKKLDIKEQQTEIAEDSGIVSRG